MKTLADIPRLHAGSPGRVALFHGDKAIDFATLEATSNRVARALRRSHGDGARIGVLAADRPNSFAILYGVAKANQVFVPINWKLRVPEIEHIVRHAKLRCLFVGPEHAEAAKALAASLGPDLEIIGVPTAIGTARSFAAWSSDVSDAPIDHGASPESPCVQLYTSGTTGRPKGVVLAHRSFFAVTATLDATRGPWLPFGADDRIINPLPLFHVGGLWWAIAAHQLGAPVVQMEQFSPRRMLELVARHRVTHLGAVPAMLRMLLDEPWERFDLRSVRSIIYGGSPCDPALLARIRQRIDCSFAQFYGLTETGNTAVCLRPDDHRDLDGPRSMAAGRPYDDVRVRCVRATGEDADVDELGEILVHSPANMLEYADDPEATARTLVDGWVHTGDLGSIDADGYVYIRDRLKDMVITAGEKVYPAEVEEAIATHPGVREVAVIGVPHDAWGEAVHAFVVPSDPDLDERELLRQLKGRIADFKIPRGFSFVDALPRTVSGKVMRHALRRGFWDGRARQVN